MVSVLRNSRRDFKAALANTEMKANNLEVELKTKEAVFKNMKAELAKAKEELKICNAYDSKKRLDSYDYKTYMIHPM